MNKNLHLLLALVFVSTFSAMTAQSTFKLTQTGYVGALTPDATKDWTTGWTNFDPKNAVYADVTDTTELNGMVSTLALPGVKEITGTTTLVATKTYLLKGFVVVKSGGKLVIPAGTVIRGIADLNASPKNYGTIVVERGGKIEITGTATNPVVMTSNKAVGSRDRGDWGGLVLCGKAVNNQLNGTDNNNVQLEGFNGVSFKDATNTAVNPQIGFHGGTDNADNTGIIRYLRVEFAGLAFEANKEINGVTFGSIGSGTEVKGVQVSFSNDDSFEWFGGTVNSSNLIAWKGTDDDFDTDFGYSGLSQFGLAVKDTAYYDGSWTLASGASTSEGFESDNEAVGTSGAAAAISRTNCVFSNFTMIGPIPMSSSYAASSTETKGAFRRGARIRRNSSQRIVNSIFMGYRNFLMIDGDSTVRNTNWPAALALVTPNTAVDVKTRQAMFSNNLIVNTANALTPATTTANGLVEVATATQLTAIDEWVRQTGPLANKINPVAFTAGTLLVNPSAYSTTPNFRPIANSPALSGANFIDNPVLANLYLLNGAEDLKAAQLAPIYPNPISNGFLNFGREVVSFGIFDNTGKLILHGFDTNQVNINSLAKGLYFIKLDGQVQKFIVQ
jgi:hypothetical protein